MLKNKLPFTQHNSIAKKSGHSKLIDFHLKMDSEIYQSNK